ncbi:MAG: hypothetical protein WDM70_04795 [Nitrosomonadales bacterium]
MVACVTPAAIRNGPWGDITQVIEESVAAHKVVKLFGGQQYESDRFK